MLDPFAEADSRSQRAAGPFAARNERHGVAIPQSFLMLGWRGKLIRSTLQHFKDETEIKSQSPAWEGFTSWTTWDQFDESPGRSLRLLSASAPATGGPGPPAENPRRGFQASDRTAAPSPHPSATTHPPTMTRFIISYRSNRLPPPLIDDVTADRTFFPESCVLSSKRSRPPEVDGRGPRCLQAPAAAGSFPH